ncbi:phospholipase A2, minor isoenzyme-like [Paramuricea clavata]|uniref:Phospholipase A2 n=1 Tax=Paramuricea clavata TaxID=317549 RepID=A0A6S7HB37_PARCT|nr:phospholipase A2, minor isoenzyme-like [Paramuricea clavata]
MGKCTGMHCSMNCQMYLLIMLAVVILSGTESVEQIHSRSRRSLIDFGNMVGCTTGRNPLDYLNYGCYCGLGGNGKILDAVDRCCYNHDNCYRQLRKRRLCTTFALYLTSYDYNCPAKCSSKNKGCSRGLCRCDRQVARCFKRNKYNPKLKNINKNKIC